MKNGMKQTMNLSLSITTKSASSDWSGELGNPGLSRVARLGKQAKVPKREGLEGGWAVSRWDRGNICQICPGALLRYLGRYLLELCGLVTLCW